MFVSQNVIVTTVLFWTINDKNDNGFYFSNTPETFSKHPGAVINIFYDCCKFKQNIIAEFYNTWIITDHILFTYNSYDSTNDHIF